MLYNGLVNVILKSTLERWNECLLVEIYIIIFYLTISFSGSNYRGLYLTVGVFLELHLMLQWKLEIHVTFGC